MTRVLSQKEQQACQSFSTIDTEIIMDYKVANNRERDIMWMQYRHLRKLFDEITDNGEYYGLCHAGHKTDSMAFNRASFFIGLAT